MPVFWGPILSGAAAGSVAGLFGAGGGMILVPLLSLLCNTKDDTLFPTSLSVMFPICLVSVIATALVGTIPWADSLPYLAGSILGGIAAGILGPKIPVKWLHRLLGCLILWGGFRYLW